MKNHRPGWLLLQTLRPKNSALGNSGHGISETEKNFYIVSNFY
jgi:hypothetical protein